MCCIIFGENPVNNLYISVASIYRFLWQTVADLSIERSSSNDEKWSLLSALPLLQFGSWGIAVCCGKDDMGSFS